MSAQLTVYTMAIEAERPVRMRAAEQASLAAQADMGSGQRLRRLLRHLGSALGKRRSPGSGVAAERRMATSPGGCRVVGQLAG
jgi:hypothetical protein